MKPLDGPLMFSVIREPMFWLRVLLHALGQAVLFRQPKIEQLVANDFPQIDGSWMEVYWKTRGASLVRIKQHPAVFFRQEGALIRSQREVELVAYGLLGRATKHLEVPVYDYRNRELEVDRSMAVETPAVFNQQLVPEFELPAEDLFRVLNPELPGRVKSVRFPQWKAPRRPKPPIQTTSSPTFE